MGTDGGGGGGRGCVGRGGGGPLASFAEVHSDVSDLH